MYSLLMKGDQFDCQYGNSNVDQLHLQNTYRFTNLYVRTYLDEKCLTLSQKSGYEVIADESIPQLAIMEENFEVFKNAMIVGTQHFNVNYPCINCYQKLPDENR